LLKTEIPSITLSYASGNGYIRELIHFRSIDFKPGLAFNKVIPKHNITIIMMVMRKKISNFDLF